MPSIVIETERFVLRPLTEADVSERYLQWLTELEARRFITAASSTTTLEILRQYVRDFSNRQDAIFLGIFERHTYLHIGNIKYDPVNHDMGYTIAGMLIGDSAYRGKGVGGEVFAASASWLQCHRNISQIVAGIHKENLGCIRMCEKVGFRIANTPHIPNPGSNALTMVWVL